MEAECEWLPEAVGALRICMYTCAAAAGGEK